MSDFECIVVGGGAAGLSAALVLARARRKTLVIDSGEQSNRAAEAIGGLLGADGEAPADFYARSLAGLQRYPAVSVRGGAVVDGRPANGGFDVSLDDGESFHGRAVLLATGMEYRPPSPASASAGVDPCSTAPSATAGRSGGGRSGFSTTRRRASTERCF